MNATATAPARYAVLVKGPRGRKWFRADSAQGGDQAFVEAAAAAVAADHPELRFRVGTGEELDAPIAPAQYRPWDTTANLVEEDVVLDELADEDL